MDRNRLTIKKIELEQFINVLNSLYNDGLDFVNMTIEKGTQQDSISFSEYKSDDYKLSTTENKEYKEITNFEDLI